MKNVYVAGPVRRPEYVAVGKDLAQSIYDTIREEGQRAHVTVLLPIPESDLDRMNPSELVEAIRRRIASADGVISVIVASASIRRRRNAPGTGLSGWIGAAAGGIEAAFAAVERKKQLIVLDGTENAPPRMLEGLPGVVSLVEASNTDEIRMAVRQFLESESSPQEGKKGAAA